MSIVRCILFLSFLLAHIENMYADSWGSPEPIAAVSERGGWVVRIVPGEISLEAVSSESALLGECATAFTFRFDKDSQYVKHREIRLVNLVSPVFAAISESGTLVTLDDWGSLGAGKVVSIYSSNGKHHKSFSLDQLYSHERISKMRRTVSSLVWRCGIPMLNSLHNQLRIEDTIGGVLTIDISTGESNYQSGGSRCAPDAA